MKNLEVERCLRKIAAKHGGLLSPAVVVLEASNPKHPLHSKFTWNDSEAAHEHRLSEARQLIRVCVEVVANNTVNTPVFVSLSTDRPEGIGYRVMAEVMTDESMREQLLRDALSEMNSFARKYAHLKQLAEVFSAISKVRTA